MISEPLAVLIKGPDIQPVIESGLGLKRKPETLKLESLEATGFLQAHVAFGVPDFLDGIQVRKWAAMLEYLSSPEKLLRGVSFQAERYAPSN